MDSALTEESQLSPDAVTMTEDHVDQLLREMQNTSGPLAAEYVEHKSVFIATTNTDNTSERAVWDK